MNPRPLNLDTVGAVQGFSRDALRRDRILTRIYVAKTLLEDKTVWTACDRPRRNYSRI
jgi:hypothetical protein